MWKTINDILVNIDNLVWGIPLMVLILAGGILLTVRLGVMQFRKLPLALKWMVKNEEGGEGEISSFSALCTALSATIGTGNIVGVATAVGAGGPGALFWMIVAAFFGMATIYAEATLALTTRQVDKDGTIHGDQICRRSPRCKIPCCRKRRSQPWRSVLLHRTRYGKKMEMACQNICFLWRMCRTFRNWNFQSGKWYFQCRTELL